jgi:peroxiredoxin
MPLLEPGHPAPDLALTAVGGDLVTLSTLWQNAPTVIAFYRGDACPMCNRYLHELQLRYDEFESAGIRVVAISSDQPELGQETVTRHDLSFDVLADPDRAAIDAFDVIYNDAEGHAEPAIFVIAPGGTLAYESIVSGALGRPSVDDVLTIARRVGRSS